MDAVEHVEPIDVAQLGWCEHHGRTVEQVGMRIGESGELGSRHGMRATKRKTVLGGDVERLGAYMALYTSGVDNHRGLATACKFAELLSVAAQPIQAGVGVCREDDQVARR